MEKSPWPSHLAGLRSADWLCACAVLLLVLSYRDLDSVTRQLVLAGEELNVTGNCRQDILIFNRVPKVGSVTINNLVGLLRERNNFAAFTSLERMPVNKDSEDIWYPDVAMRKLAVDSIIGAKRDDGRPMAFLKHQNFFDFSEFGHRSPIYMNFVRHPVERIISWYYYVRAPWYQLEEKGNRTVLKNKVSLQDLKRPFEDCVRGRKRRCIVQPMVHIHGNGWVPDYVSQISFFCGHSEECNLLESEELYGKAIQNVDKYFAVIGVLEDWQKSLAVLEAYLPRFFRGARAALREDQNEEFRHMNRNTFKPKTDPALKRDLAANLTREIDFYHYCRQRLHKQFLLIQDKEKKDEGADSLLEKAR